MLTLFASSVKVLPISLGLCGSKRDGLGRAGLVGVGQLEAQALQRQRESLSSPPRPPQVSDSPPQGPPSETPSIHKQRSHFTRHKGNICFPSIFIRASLQPLLAGLQTVVLQALHVAVHTGAHVTPAAFSLAVQFNQVDDMQHDTPLGGGPAPLLIGVPGGSRRCVNRGAPAHLSRTHLKLGNFHCLFRRFGGNCFFRED
ncbi:hypothetical protein DPEC_G00046070 [Dallia pectoralis]|uniref:Uncharacterized protein n=1 Tax=Dallia pectoralis TaxID=75939 RepID=A0ACC2HAK0_DALPE|nr:hypothetical protein DPEC_G00046070 [Dallia pectoralis]